MDSLAMAFCRKLLKSLSLSKLLQRLLWRGQNRVSNRKWLTSFIEANKGESVKTIIPLGKENEQSHFALNHGFSKPRMANMSERVFYLRPELALHRLYHSCERKVRPSERDLSLKCPWVWDVVRDVCLLLTSFYFLTGWNVLSGGFHRSVPGAWGAASATRLPRYHHHGHPLCSRRSVAHDPGQVLYAPLPDSVESGRCAEFG